jgi:hypothetical protein
MAAIDADDVSISTGGAIRWEGAATTNRHSVLEFIQFLMDKQDDGVAAGNDILDITVDTPFDRSTDQIVTLNSPFNIDDTFALHLYDGSVAQTNQVVANGGEDLYSGLNIIGPVVSGTQYMIFQNGKTLPGFWTTGINPEAAPSLVFSRHLIKSKVAGSQIDGQRITVLARELASQFRRFPVTLGTGNSVAAIGNGLDIFNETLDATLAGYDGTIINTEGFQELNIDGTGATGQEFYSQWDPDTQSINDTYEFTKWISQRAHSADANAESAEAFIIDDNDTTSVGIGSEFSATGNVEHLVQATASIRIGAGTAHTGTLYCLLYDSDDVATAAPTGAILARSEPILASAITATFEDVIFRFNRLDPTDGTDQSSGLLLVPDQEYFFFLKHDEGSATDYFEAEGDTTTADDGNFARETPPATFVGVGTSALQFDVRTSRNLHQQPGETIQGINVDVGYDGEGGTGVAEDEVVFWGTKIVYDAPSGTFIPGEQITIREDGTLAFKVGGELLFADGTDMVVSLDAPSAAVIDDNDVIEGITSGATAVINVAGGAIEDESLGGGTGLVLAIDDNTGAGELYIQILTGVSPVEDNRIRSPNTPLTNLVDATNVIVPRVINPEFVGTSTGSNIIGAYGIGFDPDEVNSSDRFTDLAGDPRIPQNNVQFTVSGLIAGEDRVLVGPRTTTTLERGMWLTATAALNTLTETAVILGTGSDTVPFPDAQENWPDAGTGALVSRLRIARDDGIFQLIPYDSHNGTTTFTLGTPVSGTVTLNVTGVGGAGGQFDRTSGSFITDGFEQGARFTVALTPTSDGDYTADSISADGLSIVVVDDTGMTNESGNGDETVTGIGWDFTDATDGVGPSGWDSSEAAIGNEVFMGFIDLLAAATTASFTGVHSTNRNLFVRVRDGGTAGDGIPTKTFEANAAQFLSTPQSVAATRTDDA